MKFSVKNITTIGLLTAITVVLQLLANYISFGPVNITLSLIPIVIGALICGPWGGLFLGLVNGAIILAAPGTSVFLTYKPLETIFLCLFKTGIAGLAAGFLPLILKKHQKIAVIIASIMVPIINTGLFALGCLLFFMDIFSYDVGYLFLGVIGINFIIEFSVNAILSPTVYFIYKTIKNKYTKEVSL